jgi:hypothetical protein
MTDLAGYRILQISPTAWALDAALDGGGGWRFVGKFDNEDAAKSRVSELVAEEAWKAPAPIYYDGTGKAIVTEPDDAAT